MNARDFLHIDQCILNEVNANISEIIEDKCHHEKINGLCFHTSYNPSLLHSDSSAGGRLSRYCMIQASKQAATSTRGVVRPGSIFVIVFVNIAQWHAKV